MMQANPRRMAGFTLIELMVTLVIAALLMTVAYPSYTQYVTRSHRQAAKSALYTVAERQEQFFLDNKRYAANLSDLGFATATVGIGPDGQITAAGDPKRTYVVSIGNPGATTFTAVATPALSQAARDEGCGALTLTHTNVRGQGGQADNCW